MTFGQALELIKQNKSVARIGWNGQGMYIFLVYGQEKLTETINGIYGDPTDTKKFPVRDAIYMKTADNQLVPWVASQTDLLAEDWTIVG